MSEDEMLYCLIAFVLGYILCKYMGNGFSVGGSRRSRKIRQENPSEENNCKKFDINSLDDYIEKIVNHKKGGFPSKFDINKDGIVTGMCLDDTGSAANMRKNDCIYDWCSFTQSPPPPPSSNTKIPNGDLCFGNLNPRSQNQNPEGDQGFCKDDSYCLNILDWTKLKPILIDEKNINKLCDNNIHCITNMLLSGETSNNISEDFINTRRLIYNKGKQYYITPNDKERKFIENIVDIV